MPQTFLAGISYQPFVKNVTQRGKIILALCAVNAVIDCNETDVFLWENHFRILDKSTKGIRYGGD